jgi:hypothetical protein
MQLNLMTLGSFKNFFIQQIADRGPAPITLKMPKLLALFISYHAKSG